MLWWQYLTTSLHRNSFLTQVSADHSSQHSIAEKHRSTFIVGRCIGDHNCVTWLCPLHYSGVTDRVTKVRTTRGNQTDKLVVFSHLQTTVAVMAFLSLSPSLPPSLFLSELANFTRSEILLGVENKTLPLKCRLMTMRRIVDALTYDKNLEEQYGWLVREAIELAQDPLPAIERM